MLKRKHRRPGKPEGIARERPSISVAPCMENLLELRHPLGVKPLGNFFIDRLDDPSFDPCARQRGLGALALLTDELVLEIFGFLDARGMLRLGSASKALYAFAHHDDLWRELCVSELGGDFIWVASSWRASYLHTVDKSYMAYELPRIQSRHLYSDALFQPFFCASTGMSPYLGPETIPRRSNLSLSDFRDQYELPNLPVIITDVVPTWPAFKSWSLQSLRDSYGMTLFRAESITLPFSTYLDYATSTTDESPLYLFDKDFAVKCPSLAQDYVVPPYFASDYFSVLGPERPDFRWLIIGPARSGSTFHKDPNATSAWNAVIRGAKKWIMYPPHVTPPGVFVSDDHSEVTSPVSLMEWHLNFYAATKDPTLPRPLEGICREGEVIFVPAGWWHLVVNLEDSIAVTHNYVGDGNLPEVLGLLFLAGRHTCAYTLA